MHLVTDHLIGELYIIQYHDHRIFKFITFLNYYFLTKLFLTK